MCEYYYKKYKAGKKKFVQMPLPGGFIIDFKHFVQIKARDPSKQRKVRRGQTTLTRSRPSTNARWNDSVFSYQQSKMAYSVDK